MPEPVPTSRTESPGLNDALHRFEAQLRAGMLAGAALQSGIDFQAEAAGRRRLGAPRRDHEELLAHQDRRPGVVGVLDPIGVVGGFDGSPNLRGGFAIVEERFTQPSCSMIPAFRLRTDRPARSRAGAMTEEHQP